MQLGKSILLLFLGCIFLSSSAFSAYIDNGDGTVTDTISNLMWQQATAQDTYNLQEAFNYCDGLILANKNDWRLPSLDELQSLVDSNYLYPAINTDFFPDTQSNAYWTSTNIGGYLRYPYFIDFSTGYVNFTNPSFSYYVRAVRGGYLNLTLQAPTMYLQPAEEVMPFGTLTSVANFNNDADTYIISHGWNRTDNVTTPEWEIAMGDAIAHPPIPYLPRNVLLWNWQEEAHNLTPPIYDVHASGRYLAERIISTIPSDYAKKIHMIGHSLGSGVIVRATEHIFNLNSDLRDNIQQLTFLDPGSIVPLGSQVSAGGEFLRNNQELFFIDNYDSSWIGKHTDIADTNINLNRSGEARDCVESDLWYSNERADKHGYAYVWYYSSINNFKNKELLCDETAPSTFATGGFNFTINHANVLSSYSQFENNPRWAILNSTITTTNGEVRDLNKWDDPTTLKTSKLQQFAYNNRLQITIKNANAFNTLNDTSAFYTNETGNAVYDSLNGTIKLITHSDAIVHTEIDIPSDANSMRFSYEFSLQAAGGVLDVFINEGRIFNAYSDDTPAGTNDTDWIDISSYAGQHVTLAFRLSNLNPTQYSAAIDDILISRILLTIDTDNDGIIDGEENCSNNYNPQQTDADSDGTGDVCDPTPGCGGCGQATCEQYVDSDSDGIPDVIDNCPTVCNSQQLDADNDGTGDVCDTSPGCGGCGQVACEVVCAP